MTRFFLFGLLILTAVMFPGCATEIRDPKTGIIVFKSYGDAKNITYAKTGDSYQFHADDLNHSMPTRAGGSIVGTTGVAIATSGLTRGAGILRP